MFSNARLLTKELRWCIPFMLLFGSASASQGQTLTGAVTATDGVPLHLVQVVIPSLSRGTVTDTEGMYRFINLPADTLLVEFRFVGYGTVTRYVVPASGDVTLDVVLHPVAVELGETIITAEQQAGAMLTRSTRSVSVLDIEDLDAMRGQTLGGMLSELPGVTTVTTGPSISKPVIRGLHSQRLVIVNAGVAQEGQQWGGEHAPEIDPFSAGSIEVIRGAAGVEYGVGAIGGVVRIEPEELHYGTPVSGSVSLNAFSNNRHGAVSARLDRGFGARWAGRIQATARKAGSSRTPDYVIGNSGFQEFDAAVTVGRHTERSGIRLHASHFGTTLGLFSGAHIGNFDDLLRAIERGEPSVEWPFTYRIDAPKQTVDHDLVSLNGHYRLASGDWVDAQFGFQSNRRAEYDAHRRFSDPLDKPAFALDLQTSSADIRLRQKPRGRLLGNAGVDVSTQGNRNDASGFLIPNFRSTTVGLFVHEMWVTQKVTIDTGVRFDRRWLRAHPRENLATGPFVRTESRYGDVSGVLGVIWKPTDHWSVATNAGRAWRPPGVNELYNYGVHHGTAQFETGNPDLDIERSTNLDVTIRHRSEVWETEFSAYRNAMDGYIHLQPEPEPRVTIRGTFPAYRYVQRTAVLKGVDGYASVSIHPSLQLHASASVVRGTERGTGLPLPDMPSDRVRGGLEWHLPWPTLDTALHADVVRVERQDRVQDGLDYAPPPDGYTLVNIGVSTSPTEGRTPWTFSLDVDNVFDARYRDYMSRFRYFIDDPGRNVSLRAHIPIG